MVTLDHVNAGVNLVSHIVDEKLKQASNGVAKDHSKDPETQAAKEKALAVLSAAIKSIDETLANIKRPAPPPRRKVAVVKQDAPSPAENIINIIAKSGLQAPTTTLSNMATDIGGVIDDFNTVLGLPFLDQYSATLNTVPIVGLKDQQILYVQKGVPTDYWSIFSALPSGVTVSSSDRVRFFPFHGDFYLAVNQALWKKAARAGGGSDPGLSDAVNHWPKMYVDQWEHIGDTCLPDTEIVDIIPFSTLSNKTATSFHLVLFAGDGSLQVLDGDTLQATNSFLPLSARAANGLPTTPPKWTQMAYYNGNIVAFDDANNLWDLSPSFSATANTYTFSSDEQNVEPITLMTASDIGPVGIAADGFLRQRIVVPPKEQGDQSTTTWQKYIDATGITSLGVASPGVLLDMNYLTQVLKAQYIDTQMALYPVVNQIQAFAGAHKIFLTNLKTDAGNWAAASGDAAKQAIALAAAKAEVDHAKNWGQLLSDSTASVFNTVGVMVGQLESVNIKLQAQLTAVRSSLKTLQDQLDKDKDQLSVLDGALWGSVAGLIVGLIILVVGIATVNPLIIAGGGLLFVAGVVGTIVAGSMRGNLVSAIAGEQSQVDSLNTAVSRLSSIAIPYQDLANRYNDLSTFWGDMHNDAIDIKADDQVTLLEIGGGSLSDSSSIDAGLQVTNDMLNATTTYLEVLNQQGINLPPSLMSAKVSGSAMTIAQRKISLKDQLQSQIKDAVSQLNKGDFAAYSSSMATAVTIQTAVINVQDLQNASSNWFDIAALNQTAGIWNNTSDAKPAAEADPANPTSRDDLITELNAISPDLKDMLNNVISFATILQGWSQQFPDEPTTPEDQEKVKALLAESIPACDQTRQSAAKVNDGFVGFNHAATNYQLNVQGQIGTQQSNASAAQATFNQAVSDAVGNSTPGVNDWLQAYIQSLQDQFNNQMNAINATMASLQADQQSGITLNSQSLTWLQMVTTVSGNLGTIFDTIGDANSQLLVDPTLYKGLMSVEWANIIQDANTVLQIL